MDIFTEINEYIGTFEDIQGNVNVTGLVWEHDIEESVDLAHEVNVVWVEQVEDGFAITPTFDAQHLMLVTEDLFVFDEIGNVPVEVYQSNINVIAAREAAPVQVWWFGANVVHGADAFFEEVVSNCHMTIPYTQAVPYYFRTVYESFDIEFHNIEPLPGITLFRKIPVNDIINMRHNVWQEYYFNNLVLERIFGYDTLRWGWQHDVAEQGMLDDYIYTIVGKVVDEHIKFRTGLQAAWEGHENVRDVFFAWDTAVDIRGWTKLLDEALGASDVTTVYLNLLIQDILIAQAMAARVGALHNLVDEQVAIAEKLAKGFDLTITDAMDTEDTALHYWLCRALIEEQAGLAVEAAPHHVHEVTVNVTMTLDDI